MSCSGWTVMAREIPTLLPPQDPESPTDTVSPTPTFNSTSSKILWPHGHNAGRSWQLQDLGKVGRSPLSKSGKKKPAEQCWGHSAPPPQGRSQSCAWSGKDPHPMGEGLGVQAA